MRCGLDPFRSADRAAVWLEVAPCAPSRFAHVASRCATLGRHPPARSRKLVRSGGRMAAARVASRRIRGSTARAARSRFTSWPTSPSGIWKSRTASASSGLLGPTSVTACRACRREDRSPRALRAVRPSPGGGRIVVDVEDSFASDAAHGASRRCGEQFRFALCCSRHRGAPRCVSADVLRAREAAVHGSRYPTSERWGFSGPEPAWPGCAKGFTAGATLARGRSVSVSPNPGKSRASVGGPGLTSALATPGAGQHRDCRRARGTRRMRSTRIAISANGRVSCHGVP